MTNPMQDEHSETYDRQRFEPVADGPGDDATPSAAGDTGSADLQQAADPTGRAAAEQTGDEPAGAPDGDRGGIDATRDPDRAPSDGQLAPDASRSDPVAALWGADRVTRYRAHWQELQLRFVDDPRAATGEAAGLVDDAVRALVGSLEDQKRGLDEWQTGAGHRADSGSHTSLGSDAGSYTSAGSDVDSDVAVDSDPAEADTEVLRVALRNYRDFLDRLLGM